MRLTALSLQFLLCLLCLHCLLGMQSCVMDREESSSGYADHHNIQLGELETEYATQFALEGKELHVKQGEQKIQVVDLDEEELTFPLPLKDVACVSTTALEYFRALGALDRISATGYFDRLLDPGLKAELDANGVKRLELEQDGAQEGFIASESKLILCYPFGDVNVDLESIPVPKLNITEYLETHPLGRAEWLKFFGLLLDRQELADSLFATIESQYQAEVGVVTRGTPKVFFNLPFKERWYMPPKNSITVRLAEDAGMSYVFDQRASSNLDMSREEVVMDCTDADVWVIVADRPVGFTLGDLMEEDPSYAHFNAVKQGRVIMCNTREHDFFGKGVLEPHVMLRELKTAVKGEVVSDASYFRLLK